LFYFAFIVIFLYGATESCKGRLQVTVMMMMMMTTDTSVICVMC